VHIHLELSFPLVNLTLLSLFDDYPSLFYCCDFICFIWYYMASLAFFWLLFAWNTLLHLSAFSLCVSKEMNRVYFMQDIIWSCFSTYSVTLFLCFQLCNLIYLGIQWFLVNTDLLQTLCNLFPRFAEVPFFLSSSIITFYNMQVNWYSILIFVIYYCLSVVDFFLCVYQDFTEIHHLLISHAHNKYRKTRECVVKTTSIVFTLHTHFEFVIAWISSFYIVYNLTS
jgi:hypothetical protein